VFCFEPLIHAVAVLYRPILNLRSEIVRAEFTQLLCTGLDYSVVPMAGLEPARLTPLPPQDSVSTNSTTSASGSIASCDYRGFFVAA
jgi:hypothetical protein